MRAMSCGVPWRLSAVLSMISRFNSSSMSPSGHSTGPGRDAVDADFRTQFARQRARQHGESRLGGAVDRMRLQGPQRMDVDHIDDESALRPQAGRGRLRQEQRRLQIAAHEIVPLRQRDLADRRRIEARRIVDQNVQAPEFEQSRGDQLLRRVRVQKMRGEDRGRMRARAVEFVRQGNGGGRRRTIVNENIGAGGVQRARDFGADAARAAGDQHRLDRAAQNCRFMATMRRNDTATACGGVK